MVAFPLPLKKSPRCIPSVWKRIEGRLKKIGIETLLSLNADRDHFTDKNTPSTYNLIYVIFYKKGDLAGFRVHKFSMGRQSVLLAYRVENDSLVLYQVGTHENFYQNLKTYIKEIGE